MMSPEQTEAFIAGARKAMEDAVAALPFRSTPDFADVYAVCEAMLRHVIKGPQAFDDEVGEPTGTQQRGTLGQSTGSAPPDGFPPQTMGPMDAPPTLTIVPSVQPSNDPAPQDTNPPPVAA